MEGNQANPYWEAGAKDTKTHMHTTAPFSCSFPASPRQLGQRLQEAQQRREGLSHLQPLTLEKIREGGAGFSLST